MTYQKTKPAITKVVLSQLKDSKYASYPDEKLYFAWWHTGRTGTSLRLTDEGALAFEEANITYYHFSTPINPKHTKTYNPKKFLLTMSKKMKCPYWLGQSDQKDKKGRICQVSLEVKVYDNQIAMLINLYGGVFEYLESVNV